MKLTKTNTAIIGLAFILGISIIYLILNEFNYIEPIENKSILNKKAPNKGIPLLKFNSNGDITLIELVKYIPIFNEKNNYINKQVNNILKNKNTNSQDIENVKYVLEKANILNIINNIPNILRNSQNTNLLDEYTKSNPNPKILLNNSVKIINLYIEEFNKVLTACESKENINKYILQQNKIK